MSSAIVQYQAADGCEVKLSPAIVAKYIVTGNGNPSDKDVFAFMMKCQARGLNPLAGDAYMVCYGNTAQVVTSKDYFVRTATSCPTFDGMEAGVIVESNGELIYREGAFVMNNENLVGGWARVYDKRLAHPSFEAVSLEEYSSGKSMWVSKPATMIRKVAMTHAIREAYPEKFAGVYDQAELPESEEPSYEQMVAQENQEEEF